MRNFSNIHTQKARTWIIMLVFVLPLFFGLIETPFTMDTQFTVRLSLLGGYFTLAAIFYLSFSKNHKLFWSFPAICIGSLLLWQLIGALYSVNFADALVTSSITAILLLFIVVLPGFTLNYSEMKKSFLLAVVLLSSILLIYGLTEFLAIVWQEGYSHSALYNLRGTIGHKNAFSEYLFLLLPFNAFVAFYFRGFIRALGAVNTFLILALVILSLTRSVWVAAPVACLVTLFILLYFGGISGGKRIARFFFAFALVLIIVVIFWLITYPESPFSKQIMALFNFKHGSVKDRLGLWTKTLNLWIDNPVLGSGTASWKVEILSAGNEGLTSENNVVFYQRPHNDWLWLLFENGLIGFALRLLAVLSIFKLWLINLKSAKESIKEKLFLLAVLFSLVSYHVVEQFSFPVERPVFTVITGFLWVLIIKRTTENKLVKFKVIHGIFGFVVILGIGVLILLLSLGRMKSETRLKEAMALRASDNQRGVIERIDVAERYYYRLDPFSTPLKWYSATARYVSGNQNEACAEFEKALKYNPHHIYILNDAGTCSGIRGDFRGAVNQYKKSLSIAPNFNETLYNITTLYYQERKTDSAVFYFRQIDPAVDSARYSHYLNVIIKPIIDDLIKEVDEQELKNELTNMMYNEQWITIVLRKPEDLNVKFRTSALDNVLYITRKNNTFTPDKINSLFKKYQL